MLRYGSQKMKEGVSYNEVKDYLLKKGDDLNEYNEDSIKLWFCRSFYHVQATYNAERVLRGETTNGKFNLVFSQHLDDKVSLMGHAYMEYIDYVELKEAREASSLAHEAADKANTAARKSIRIATWAVGLSALLALGSLLLQFGSIILQVLSFIF